MMKKIPPALLIVIIIFLACIVFVFLRKPYAKEAAPDYRDTAFKLKMSYFGDDAFGDFNGDGKQDVAYIVTQDNGGSGTFYYIVAALRTDTGYVGTDPILLGDRIAPKNIQVSGDAIIVDYVDRALSDPMTAPPSINVSKTFRVINGDLAEVLNDKE